MKKLFKQPLFYTNLLLLALVILLGVNTPQARAKIIGFAKRALAAAPITGGGTINFLANFVGATSPSSELGNSIIYDDGSGHAAITTGSDPGSLDSKLEILSGIDRMIEFVRAGASFPTVFRMGSVDGALVINNNNADALTIKNGNVGIGTTNPSNAKLEVVVTSGEAGHFTSSAAGGAAELRIQSTDTNGNNWNIQSVGNVAGRAGNLELVKSGGTTGLIINTNGNVGIGTPIPSRALDVRTSAGVTALFKGTSSNAEVRIESTGGNNATLDIGDQTSTKIHLDAFGNVQFNQPGNVSIGEGILRLVPRGDDPQTPGNGTIWMRQ